MNWPKEKRWTRFCGPDCWIHGNWYGNGCRFRLKKIQSTMTNKTTKRLEDIRAKAVTEGHWPLAAAVHQALTDEANLDFQINVVGALHETGSLRHRIEPFWQLWRKDE